MNDTDFGKTMKNVRKHRDIKLVTTERRRNYLVSEPNYHIILFRFINTRSRQNYNVWILVWLHKTKYGENAKTCYMGTDSFIVHVKTTMKIKKKHLKDWKVKGIMFLLKKLTRLL